MDKFLTFTIAGLSSAAIYAIAASGLVVTYTTSGIFNFAHGAFGMMAAFTYWQVNVAWGVPTIPAVILVVFIIAPLFGAVVERVIMRGIEGASDVVKIVVTVSLMVALLGLAQVIWPQNESRPVPAFFEGRFVEVLGVRVSWSRLLALVVAGLVAGGLRLLFTRTRLGISMRAVVDDRRLLQLNGGRPGRTAMLSWGLGAGLAAVSGVLYATEQTLSAVTLTLLVVNTYAVAVVGRLRSLPGAFLGAVILGLAQSYVTGYINPDLTVGPIALGNLAAALPAIMLFTVLLLQPEARLRSHSAGRPRAPVVVPSQTTAVLGGVALVLALAGIGALLAPADLILVTKGAGFALVTLSLVPLTGYAGQISLAQMSFVGIGAVAMATWGANGSPVAVAASVAVCAVIGAVVALPALRLSGIYLALATAAFALFCTAMFFNQQEIIPSGSVQVPPLSLGPFTADTDYRQLVLLAVLFALIGNLLVWLRRSAWGRRLTAMKDSPVACATLGLNLTSTKVGVFALSAAIAGAGGALAGRTFTADSFSLPASLPVTMLAVVGGIGSIAGAFIGGLLLGAIPIASTVFAANAIGVFRFVAIPVRDILSFTPGLMGISLGREPDGAAPQIAVGYRAVGRSVPALVVSVAGAVALWLAARTGVVTKWGFAAALLVFVVAAVPLLPLVLSPARPEDTAEPPRRLACGLWLALATLVAVAIPWADRIASNGLRVVLIVVAAALSARVGIGVLGVTPEQLRRPVPPSPDLVGVDRPMLRADAVEATRRMGLSEDDFEAEVAALASSTNGAPVGPVTVPR